jgi:hypothetical protein
MDKDILSFVYIIRTQIRSPSHWVFVNEVKGTLLEYHKHITQQFSRKKVFSLK